jgi:hypothetical protein
MPRPSTWRRNEIGRGCLKSSHPLCRRIEDNGAPKRCNTRCRSQDRYTFQIPGTRCSAYSSPEYTALWVTPLSWKASCSWNPPSVVSLIVKKCSRLLYTCALYYREPGSRPGYLPSLTSQLPWREDRRPTQTKTWNQRKLKDPSRGTSWTSGPVVPDEDSPELRRNSSQSSVQTVVHPRLRTTEFLR